MSSVGQFTPCVCVQTHGTPGDLNRGLRATRQQARSKRAASLGDDARACASGLASRFSGSALTIFGIAMWPLPSQRWKARTPRFPEVAQPFHGSEFGGWLDVSFWSQVLRGSLGANQLVYAASHAFSRLSGTLSETMLRLTVKKWRCAQINEGDHSSSTCSLQRL